LADELAKVFLMYGYSFAINAPLVRRSPAGNTNRTALIFILTMHFRPFKISPLCKAPTRKYVAAAGCHEKLF
jgi:hypothetical protein